MDQIRLGQTELVVSRLGFGCSSFWAKSAFPEADASRLIHRALDLGVSFFDTGSSYASGQAEQRLGRALQDRERSDIVVATKAGTRNASFGRTYKDFTPSGIRTSVEQSLRNLQLDAIPLLHLHVPRPEDITDELVDGLERLRDRGLVRYFGIHGGAPGLRDIVLNNPIFDTAMFDYNVLHVGRKPRIAELKAAGKAFLGATPLAQMLFSRRMLRPTRLADLWYLTRAMVGHRADLQRAQAFRFLEEQTDWTGAELALAYALSNADVSVCIFGTTSEARLRENIEVLGRSVPAELIQRIEAS